MSSHTLADQNSQIMCASLAYKYPDEVFEVPTRGESAWKAIPHKIEQECPKNIKVTYHMNRQFHSDFCGVATGELSFRWRNTRLTLIL